MPPGLTSLFFSGNEVFWKTRWENSSDPSNTAYRTLVSYKETHNNAKTDPLPDIWTGTWRDPRFSPLADGGRPENELTGTIFTVNLSDPSTHPLTVPEPDGKMRFWRHTDVATLAPGETATLADDTLGYEWDEDLDNGFRPAGLIRLSTTTVNNVQHLQDFGSTYEAGTATHNLTLYRHRSGALVFGAGTINWAWGLDGQHDGLRSTPDGRMQQATVNLFADMGVQPGSLQPELVQATQSTDLTAPISTISTPITGTVISEATVPITGTTSDVAGVVGGVEVSIDGGLTWRRAEGRETWRYEWRPTQVGPTIILSRAVDDSGNLERELQGVQVNVLEVASPATTTSTLTATTEAIATVEPSPTVAKEFNGSVWGEATTPSEITASDSNAVELGVKFQSDMAGFVTGIRFYKGPRNTGTHVGNLWTSSGQLLATATFTNETASGWQQVDFVTPQPITANTTYVASYHTKAGFYSVDKSFFSAGEVANPPLRFLAEGDESGNGVFQYGAGGFPTESSNSSNYWVDVVFVTKP